MTINHYRIIDANLNRLREGIRVVEDIFRYELNCDSVTLTLKNLRHESASTFQEKCIVSRNVSSDCLKNITTKSESNKNTLNDIVTANIKRAQESARVLEELFKLYEEKESLKFKSIRYKLYEIEQEILAFLKSLQP